MASKREPPAIGRHYSRKTKAQLIEELESLQDGMDELKHTLREFQENHELAQKAARKVLWDWSEKTGILNTSPEAWNKLGLADLPHQGPFEEWKEVIHPNDVDRYWAVLTAYLKGDTDQYENESRIRQKDGGYGWVHDRGLALRDQNGRVYRMAGTISDITERKQAEEALRLSEQRLSTIFHTSPHIMTITGLEDGLFYDVNDTWLAITGYTRDEVIGRTSSKELNIWVNPEHRKQVVALMTKQGYVRNFGTELNGRDGRVMPVIMSIEWIEIDGEQRLLSVSTDITEWKQAEKAARESEEKYRSLVELSPDAVFVQQGGRIVFANSSAVRHYGANEPEQLVGRETTGLVHPEDRHLLLERRDILRRDKEKQVFGALRRLRLDGSEFYGESVVSVIPWRGAQATMIVVRDNTERQAIEDQLRHSQKMEAIGQLTGGIAHDFNNLLAVVLGNLELATDELAGEEKARGLVDAAIRGAERGAELTHRLLAFSRKQVLRPKAIDLNAHIFGMTDLLRRTLGETIKIETKLADGLWRSVVDPGQIESAILNLAINARDAMPEGGKLTIETANMPLDDDYAAAQADVTPGDYVMVAVSDSGTGMTPEVMAHAFEPFFTTKTVGASSGLGLSMVYGFAEQSNGHVAVYSEVGEGTTIKLYLPRSLDKPAADAPSTEAGTPVGRGETILVIEDDADVRTVVVTLLSYLGYRVLEAKDGPAALAELDRERSVNLVLSDVVLPGGLTGPQLATEIRDRHGEIPIMYMSGYTENAVVHQGKLDAGVILLQKPFRKADLARKIRQALG